PRHDGRATDDLRPVRIERGFLRNSAGSALYRAGATTVLVSAHISDKVPPFLEGKGVGWLTAEYGMLPGSTPTRKPRGPDGRSTEIQRLIGRSLRAVLDTRALGPWTIHVDAVVRLGRGGLVEVQGTGEGGTFSRDQLRALLDLAEAGIDRLGLRQREVLGDAWPFPSSI